LAAASNSLVGSSNLVSKVYFPRILIPFATPCSLVLDLVISFIVLCILMAGYQVSPSSRAVLLPVFALYVIGVSMGAGLLLSALGYVYFRRVERTFADVI